MKIFDRFKKKPQPVSMDEYTYIAQVHRSTAGPWQQYDILLASRGYGWEGLLAWADYLAQADLMQISQVTTKQDLQGAYKDITAQFHENRQSVRAIPLLRQEGASLTLAGISRTLGAPIKIMWINQSRMLCFFTIIEDEMLIRCYAETMIRRTFGTENAMKPAKPLPENK